SMSTRPACSRRPHYARRPVATTSSGRARDAHGLVLGQRPAGPAQLVQLLLAQPLLEQRQRGLVARPLERLEPAPDLLEQLLGSAQEERAALPSPRSSATSASASRQFATPWR